MDLQKIDNSQKFSSLYLVEQINIFREQEGNSVMLVHSDFLKKIRVEFEEEIGMGKISDTPYIHPQNGQEYKMFELDYEQSLQILMSENKTVRKRVVEVLKKQQEQINSLKIHSYQIEDPIARAEAWIQEQKEKIALAESNKQLETKVDNLSTAFMYESNWLSILKVSMHNKVSEKVFDWRKLKQASDKMGYEVKKMQSRRFKYQNLYHIDTFRVCYPQYNYNFENN